jgi:adenylate kinase family enzyme
MGKVAIIGNAGGGKSVLSKKLARAKRLPVYAVDKYQWKPGWRPVPETDVRADLDSLLTNDRWIIDGWGPWDCIVRRFLESDTIVFVDLPVWIHLWWAAKRQIRALVLPWTIEKPEGCALRWVTVRMFRMILAINKTAMPDIRALVAGHEEDKNVFHITSRKDLRAFVKAHC